MSRRETFFESHAEVTSSFSRIYGWSRINVNKRTRHGDVSLAFVNNTDTSFRILMGKIATNRWNVSCYSSREWVGTVIPPVKIHDTDPAENNIPYHCSSSCLKIVSYCAQFDGFKWPHHGHAHRLFKGRDFKIGWPVFSTDEICWATKQNRK